MARWQIFNGAMAVDQWDDGLKLKPDEPGFSRAEVDAHCKTLGEKFTASYMGTPNWVVPPEVSADDVRALLALAAAEAADPAAFALLRDHAALRAEFAPLERAAGDDATRAALAALLEKKLAALSPKPTAPEAAKVES